MSAQSNGRERRVFGRRPMMHLAFALLGRRSTVRCVVRNLSLGGALLEFQDEMTLPYAFQIAFEGGPQELHCEVRHQDGRFVGVEFVGEQSLETARGMLKAGGPAPIAAPAEAGSAAKPAASLRRG